MFKKSENNMGYVYILVSKNCDSIKIGGTEFPPIKRIKEINNTEPYKGLGKWHLADFRQVSDWRKVEYFLHYKFRSAFNSGIKGQKELFQLPVNQASQALNEVDEDLVIN